MQTEHNVVKSTHIHFQKELSFDRKIKRFYQLSREALHPIQPIERNNKQLFSKKKNKNKKTKQTNNCFQRSCCQARAEIKQSQLTPTLRTSLSANYPSQLFSLKEKNKVGSGRKIQSEYWKSTFDKIYVN